MRIGQIIIKLRLADTYFKNYIGGSVELTHAQTQTLKTDMAFVIPLDEVTSDNKNSSEVFQRITERFAVLVALRNDISMLDKLGYIAADRLHDIRDQLFKALLGWRSVDMEDFIIYRGGKLLDHNPAYIWYQYDFSYDSEIQGNELCLYERSERDTKIYDIATEVASGMACLQTSGKYQGLSWDQIKEEIPPEDMPTFFNVLYTQYFLADDTRLPYTGELPFPDDFPDVTIPDNATWLDMNDNPYDGAFGSGFSLDYNVDRS